MTTLSSIGAPYSYIQSEKIVSHVQELLDIDLPPTPAGPTSIIISQDEPGEDTLLKLEGLGKDLWSGVDAQKYIKELRDEWE